MSKISLSALLTTMLEKKASDLHISAGSPPLFRIQGKIVKIKADPLTRQETKEICYSVITEAQKAEFEKNYEIDFSFSVKNLARFRGNIFFQKNSVGGVFRLIPLSIPEFKSLFLPQVLLDLIKRPNGLILVTGPTGSGKSTSLASLIDVINEEDYGHIITVEDPIEFLHNHKNCVVNQREIGVDTKGFAQALKRILRQDPDYVLVGELRDAETIEMALTMAETGHLVFGTLHTNGAVSSINRIINVFPPHQQPQIRSLLSFTLVATMSQQLVPKSYESGRCLAYELLIPNAAVKNLIRENKIQQIYATMQVGQDNSSMMTMNQSLVTLVQKQVISHADALEHSFEPEELKKMLQQGQPAQPQSFSNTK